MGFRGVLMAVGGRQFLTELRESASFSNASYVVCLHFHFHVLRYVTVSSFFFVAVLRSSLGE